MKMANSKPAVQGEKMIEIRIRFFTNNIAQEKDRVIPKHCWDSGMISMEKNTLHEIHPATPKPFPSLSALQGDIEKVLTNHGIVMHHSRRSKKLFKC
jgi:hypothetical protein